MRVKRHIAVGVIQVCARAGFGFEAFVAARQGGVVLYADQVGALGVVAVGEVVYHSPFAGRAADEAVAAQSLQVADGVVGVVPTPVGVGFQYLQVERAVCGVFGEQDVAVVGYRHPVEAVVAC